MRPYKPHMTAAVKNIFSAIQQRRVEATVQGVGAGTSNSSNSSNTAGAQSSTQISPLFHAQDETGVPSLVRNCMKAIIDSLGEPCQEDRILQLCERLPRDIRLILFDEISRNKLKMDESIIHLLKKTDIRFVSFASDRVTSKGMGILAEACPNLQHLYLRGCNSVTIDGLNLVLKTCPSIVSVDLGWTTLFEQANEQQVKVFFDLLNPNLKLLSIRGSGMRWLDMRVTLISQKCKNLNTLNLGKIKNFKPEFLTETLSQLKQITDFDVSGNRLQDAEVSTIATLTNTTLKNLDLERSFCTDAGVEHLTINCPNLEILNFQNVPIGDAAIHAIAKNCTNLRSLNVAGCFEVTDAPLLALAASCPKLQEINLQGLLQLTPASITALCKCPLLTGIEIPENAKLITADFRKEMGGGKDYKRSKKVPTFME